MRKNILTTFCIIILTLFVNEIVQAQVITKPMKEMFSDGQYFYNREDYQEAVYYFLRLLETDTANANLNFKVGNCYLNIQGQETKAIPFLERAAKNITADYDKKSIEEREAPLHALYYLGNAYRMNDEIEKALETYETFTSSPYYEGNYNVSIVENEIAATERAKTIIDNPVEVEFEKQDTLFNTESREFRPVLSGDGNHMAFVRKLKFYDAVFYTHKENGKWTQPIVINPMIKSDGNHYPTSISYYGEEIYFVEQRDFNQDIYVSKFVHDRWQPLEELGRKVNSRGNETHAAISDDGKKLIFASDRWGGEGGLDLYMSTRGKDGEWNKARNLGAVINTAYDENSAYFTNNDSSIFFSSSGHFKMGGYDVFYSNLIDGEWNTPVNIGYPLNTTANNLYYQPIEGGNAILLSRFENKGDTENLYIARMQSPLDLVKTTDGRSNASGYIDLNAARQIYMIDKSSGDTSAVFHINTDEQKLEIQNIRKDIEVISR